MHTHVHVLYIGLQVILAANKPNAYLNNDLFFTPSHNTDRKGRSVVSGKLLISFEIPHQASVGNSTHVTMTTDSHLLFWMIIPHNIKSIVSIWLGGITDPDNEIMHGRSLSMMQHCLSRKVSVWLMSIHKCR